MIEQEQNQNLVENKIDLRGTVLSQDFINLVLETEGDQYRFIRLKDGTVYLGLSDTTFHKDLVKLAGLDINDIGTEVVDGGFFEPSGIPEMVNILSYSAFLEEHGVHENKQINNRPRTLAEFRRFLPKDTLIME